MNKEEILRGMKLSRAVHDQILENKFVLRTEFDTGTTVAKSGFAVEIGDNQPTSNNTIWFDTSEYVSVQGATPNFTVGNGKLNVIVSDIQPDTYDIWLDTSKYGG